MKTSLLTELKTLLWLQWKLTLSMFRSRRAADWFWLLRLGLNLIQFIFTIPFFLVMGIGVAIGLAVLSPGAAYEVAMIGNTFMMFVWLMMPSAYSSQVVERFEMARLFPHPISFRGIVIGSTLVGMLNMTGLWTIPILAGEVIGLAWHRPLAAPLIALGALPAFAFFALVGRLMDNVFDLVASDRRLRSLMLFLVSVPFILLWLGQYYVQYISDNFETLPDFIDPTFALQLQQAQSFSEVVEILNISRYLIWLPTGWVTAGMSTIITAPLWQGLLFLLISFVTIGGLLWLHAKVTRHLMSGVALSVGIERVRTRGLGFEFPGPADLWTLIAKDWRSLWRNPLLRRMLFASLIIPVATAFPLLSMPQEDLTAEFGNNIAIFMGLFIVFMLNMMLNMALTGNYFGAIDREGFGTLLTSVKDWRHVLLAANSVMLVFVVGICAFIILVLVMFLGAWDILPLLLYITVALQMSTTPVYNLSSIWGPYYVELKYSTRQKQGNIWSLLGWLLGTPPVALLILLPYFMWKPGLWITIPLSALYSVGLYALTLKPLARFLQKRQHIILERVTKN